MTNINTEENATLALIEDELARLIASYDQLVEQSDKLADAMLYRKGYVLGKVMPRLALERRDSGRIATWFEENREEIMENIEQIEAARIKGEQREKLLETLGLTDAQKALLFGE
jgi:hypothetical protein